MVRFRSSLGAHIFGANGALLLADDWESAVLDMLMTLLCHKIALKMTQGSRIVCMVN